MTDLTKLDFLAMRLYDADATYDTWRKSFSKQEAIAVWDKYCVYDESLHSQPYDDEIYAVLDSYGYWDNK